MAKKDLKLNIKNKQLAQALNLDSLKDKLAKKKIGAEKEAPVEKTPAAKKKAPAKKKVAAKKKEAEVIIEEVVTEPEEVVAKPRIKARSKSAFAEVKEEEKPEEKVEELAPVEEEAAPSAVEVAEPEVAATAVEEKIAKPAPVKERLGPTGRHIKDLLPVKKPASEAAPKQKEKAQTAAADERVDKKKGKTGRFKEFREVKPVARRQGTGRAFDSRDRQGLRRGDEDRVWRKRRPKQTKRQKEEAAIRPTELTMRLPITIKDLALQMKLKASQLIAKLFMQGMTMTLNDILDDETTIQLLGHEFACDITIDTSEEERIRITDKTIREEIAECSEETLKTRPPVVAFMGHVDHGKTSLIDKIRKSNITSGEAGAITQHIGAFRCTTPVGDIAILDTPGHEAFSAMRARGAEVTDIVVLVVAGDEGIRQQTIEAIQHARAAGVSIVVAINKSDKPGFDAQNVYRQLADNDLLPEPWGGQIITVNCSAETGEGIDTLLEMLALQAEVLELRANPQMRARGSVLESEMHKGLGNVATVLVQNGTLKQGDALVFEQHWGRVKTMHDEFGNTLKEASPSTPIEITGLSGQPEAGQEFIVVPTEKEAREISEVRLQDLQQTTLKMKKRVTLENLLQEAEEGVKKVLNVILRADVQGSLEALKVALGKIESDKVNLNVIFTGIGEVSESDAQLAKASKAVVIGFHTKIESHAETLAKELGVQIKLHDIIYHAIDDVKELMEGTLDKLAEERETGKANVIATFKSSQLGTIAGCLVSEGTIHRNHRLRITRDGEQIWIGPISSIRRVKEDVREVQKGVECGIVLSTNDVQEGDVLEAFEIVYITQKL